MIQVTDNRRSTKPSGSNILVANQKICLTQIFSRSEVNNPEIHHKSTLDSRYRQLLERIRQAEQRCGRSTDSTQLLAVSKTRSADEIRALAALGQQMFGENYLQEAVEKISGLRDLPLEWHFIGRIQSNKTRPIAEQFDWVHSLASLKHARRLSEQRPPTMPPLNACLQVNTSGEASKDGHLPDDLPALLPDYAALPNLRIRGLMTIPAASEDTAEMHKPFQLLRELRDRLATPELPLETLSMGMSGDLEAAIAEGATIIRIGTAIFGPRAYNQTS
jgi:PLP dependent protein